MNTLLTPGPPKMNVVSGPPGSTSVLFVPGDMDADAGIAGDVVVLLVRHGASDARADQVVVGSGEECHAVKIVLDGVVDQPIVMGPHALQIDADGGVVCDRVVLDRVEGDVA